MGKLRVMNLALVFSLGALAFGLVYPRVAQAGVVAGPYMIDMYPDRVTLCWENVSAERAMIRYGLAEPNADLGRDINAALNQEWSSTEAALRRCVTLEDLEPGTEYIYRLGANALADRKSVV